MSEGDQVDDEQARLAAEVPATGELAELREKVQELGKSVWRAAKELEALRDSFAALKLRAGITGEVRPPLVFKDAQGKVVPEVELATFDPTTVSQAERVGTGAPVILKSSERRGLRLQAFVETQPEQPLFILFHGALQVGEQSPRFERIRTMRQHARSFCAIADPTIDLADELTLGWYVGHNSVDLQDLVVPLVESLVAYLKPPQVVFIGGSGGGFAALQASARIRNSLAFVTDPQVIVPNYYAGHVARLLTHAFDGFSVDAAMGEFGARLSVVESYRKRRPESYVYYCQHRDDEYHVNRHLGPFAELTGVPLEGGVSPDSRVFLEWFSEDGHGPLRGPGQFDEVLAKAVAWHAAKLGVSSPDQAARSDQGDSVESAMRLEEALPPRTDERVTPEGCHETSQIGSEVDEVYGGN